MKNLLIAAVTLAPLGLTQAQNGLIGDSPTELVTVLGRYDINPGNTTTETRYISVKIVPGGSTGNLRNVRHATLVGIAPDKQFPSYTVATTSVFTLTYVNIGGHGQGRRTVLTGLSGKLPDGFEVSVNGPELQNTTSEVKPDGTIIPRYCGENLAPAPSRRKALKEVCVEVTEPALVR